MAQGSPVFPEFPLRLPPFSRRTCRGSWRPAALPCFLWSPPRPRRPARVPLVSPEVPCPGALPQEEAWGVDKLSRAPVPPPGSLQGFLGAWARSCVSSVHRLPVPSSAFLHLGTHTRQVSWARPHPLGVTGTLAPTLVASIAHHFLFCFLEGCLL